MRTALQSCVDQENRAKAYRKFLKAVASCPWCVGAHYFENLYAAGRIVSCDDCEM